MRSLAAPFAARASSTSTSAAASAGRRDGGAGGGRHSAHHRRPALAARSAGGGATASDWSPLASRRGSHRRFRCRLSTDDWRRWSPAERGWWPASRSAIAGRPGTDWLAVGCWRRKTRAIVVRREATRDHFVRQGWPAEKFVVIPPGFAATGREPRAAATLPAELGLPESVHLIGIAGRLEVEEGWKEVIWTLDILRCVARRRAPGGRRRWPAAPAVGAVRPACARSTPHVHFLGRRRRRRRSCFRTSITFGREPASGEAAVAAIEALAAGVPVVASRHAENRELVIHDQTGFLVPIGDRAGRARYANRLINDPGLAGSPGRGGPAADRRPSSAWTKWSRGTSISIAGVLER